MIQLEPYSKVWYDNLAEGKIVGVKCKRCGAVKFPPYPICEKCSGTDMEWVDVDRDVTVGSVNFSAQGNAPFYSTPSIGATVVLSNGDTFMARLAVEDASLEKSLELIEKVPFKAHMDVETFENGVSYPVIIPDE